MTLLDEILAHKRSELERAKRELSPAELFARARGAAEPTRGFRTALARAARPRVIGEIKRRSPSRGEIRPDLDPVRCATALCQAGAAALSVHTDRRYFGGDPSHLEQVRRAVPVPLLRKDFVVDPYQIDEARAWGADAVLLIVAALGPRSRERLAELCAHARSLSLDALVEVHDEEELDTAAAAGADLIGVNNRDLRSFETDLGVTERLAPKAPAGALVVSESGIFGPGDLARLEACGADAFLIGESLMREEDIGQALRRLRRTP